MKTSTPIIISAMRILARDIQTDDGVANAAISEAADRLEELSPQWTRIDYDDSDTYPDENRPCIVAWEFHSDHPERNAMYQFNDVGDDMRLWGEEISGDIMDWDGTEENPTHWMYAPELRPSNRY
jgi:hypothetical protein